MNQDKKIQVVMLAKNKATTIFIDITNKLNSSSINMTRDIDLGQHLYFLSDDEIKERDWYLEYDVHGNVISKPKKADYNLTNEWKLKPYSSYCKKIVLSTDKSLGLSEPSQEWIEYFVSEYNKGNIITEVIVEYEYLVELEHYNDDGLHINYTEINSKNEFVKYHTVKIKDKLVFENNYRHLKVNPDNTINIKPVEETWNDIINKLPLPKH